MHAVRRQCDKKNWGLFLHLQDTSKLQCVEDFLEGMLGKLKFE